MTCDARIRPMPNDTEIACEIEGVIPHVIHVGVLKDYAYTGSKTTITWDDADRRTFYGEWPGPCPEVCVLPLGHRGNHAP